MCNTQVWWRGLGIVLYLLVTSLCRVGSKGDLDMMKMMSERETEHNNWDES